MDIMLDLETLSSAPDAAIVAIGACAFGEELVPGAPRPIFNIYIDPESAQKAGGRVDAGTVKWWCQQSDAARQAWAHDNGRPIAEALNVFSWWCQDVACGARVVVWGNGASFDNVVLRSAFDRLGIKVPWKYPNERCYRTLKNLRPDIEFARLGTHHNAADDAVSQAVHAERILIAMKGA